MKYLVLFLFFSLFQFTAFAAADDPNKQVVDINDAINFEKKADKFYLPESLRIFSKFMLLAYDGQEGEKLKAFDTALETLNQFYSQRNVEIIPVSSLEEYLQHRYLDRELYIDISSEIRHLKNQKAFYKFYYQATDPQVEEDIENYHRAQFHFAREKFSDLVSKGPATSVSGMHNIESYQQRFLEKFLSWESLSEDSELEARGYLHTLQALLSNEQKLQVVDAFGKVFRKMDEELRSVGEKVASDKEKFQVNMVEVPGVGRFIQLLIDGVFKNLSSIGSKNMISGLLDNPDQRTSFQKFRTVLAYGVPQLLKFLQLVARMDGIDQKLREVFASLESGGRAAPLPLVLEQLEKERKHLRRADFEILEVERAFHAGSIAQMHIVKVRKIKSGEVLEMGLRIVKPGMEDMIGRGTVNFTSTAEVIDTDPELRALNWPLMGPSIEPMDKGLYNDIDSKGASERQVQAKSEYSHTLKKKIPSEHKIQVGFLKLFPKKYLDLEISYYVPKMYYYSDPSRNGVKIQLMELVKGQKIAKIDETNKVVSREITRGLMHRWMERAFIKSGFIHADLHLGNFMVDLEEKYSGLKPNWFSFRKTETDKLKIKVPIIDYGMGGVIEKAFRVNFISLVVASRFGDATGMKEILWSLSIPEKSPLTKLEFDKVFDLEFSEQSKITDPEKRMKAKDWVVFAVNQGLVLPDQFVSLSRGTGILLTLAVRYEISKRLTGMMESTLRNNKSLFFSIIKNGLVDWKMMSSIFSRKAKGIACKDSTTKE